MRDGMEVIDADGHVMEPEDLWDRYIDREFYDTRPIRNRERIVVAGKAMARTLVGQESESYDAETFRRVTYSNWLARYRSQYEAGFTAACYLEAMDTEGIDKMFLYPSQGLYAAAVEDLDGRLSAAICRAYNRWLAEFCASAPRRLFGVALLALHDPALAVAEAEYAIRKLGLRGVMVRPNPYAGRNLEDRAYDDFYDAISDLDVPLSTHEGCGVWMPEYGSRYPSRLANHAMSHPMEQMGAVYSFTAGGVMERHPRLRVAILEGGATWLPFWLYRLDEHYEWLEDVPAECGMLSMKPSEYFRRQGWISCESDEPNVRGLVDFIGAERIIWASDFPHQDAKYPGAVDVLMKMQGLTRDELSAYAAKNARALYKLDD